MIPRLCRSCRQAKVYSHTAELTASPWLRDVYYCLNAACIEYRPLKPESGSADWVPVAAVAVILAWVVAFVAVTVWLALGGLEVGA